MKGKSCRKRIAVFFLFLLFLLLPAGCLQDIVPRLLDRTDSEREVEEIVPPSSGEDGSKLLEDVLPEGIFSYKVFFMEENGKYLLPVTIAAPWTEGIGRAALGKLIAGPTPAQEMRFGLVPLLPPSTEVLGLSIRDGLARVDLSSSFLDYDTGLEREAINSVVFTLLQFPTVEEVEILVEGIVPEVYPGGTPGGSFSAEQRGVNIEVAGEIEDFGDTRPVILYFCHVMGDNRVFYIPITRIVTGGKNIAGTVIEELLAGPRPGDILFSEIPPGTTLREITVADDLVTVDFSRDILNFRGGISGEEHLLRQIVLTLAEIPGVKRVQILVEGEAIIFPYGVSLEGPVETSSLLVNLLV
ncbi:MAG: GerMN domain-containing protein [Dethiobacteria bacterium]